MSEPIPVDENGYPTFTVNHDAKCIIRPVAVREDGVALFTRDQLDDD